MKDFLLLIAMFLLITICSFKMGAWYGHEKAIADIQGNQIAVPIPFTQMVAGSSATIYDHYILEGCLKRLKKMEELQ